MNDDNLQDLLQRCITVRGNEFVRDRLAELIEGSIPEVDTLTIIANSGVHAIPVQYQRGEVYSASQGNWNVTSQADIDAEFRKILVALGRKLKEFPWKRIYLIPTGHPALSIQIKILVYRVTRINTIDLLYSNGQYFEIQIDHREIVLGEVQSLDR